MIQLALFQEEQGRITAAEPTESRPREDSEEFERLRIELVNCLLHEMGVKVKLSSLNAADVDCMKQALRTRGTRPAPLSFLHMELYLTLVQKYWAKFNCADLREHIAAVKEAVAKARQQLPTS